MLSLTNLNKASALSHVESIPLTKSFALSATFTEAPESIVLLINTELGNVLLLSA